MSIITDAEKEFISIGHKIVAALESAFASVEKSVLTEADKGLAFIRQNEPLVTKTLNLLQSVAGGASFNTIFVEIEDEYNTFMTEGGFAHLLDEGKTLLTTFVASLKTDLANDLRAA